MAKEKVNKKSKKDSNEPVDILSLIAGDYAKNRAGKMDQKKCIQMVKCIFSSANRAFGGAIPTSCTMVLQGPTYGGKTALAQAILKGFVEEGHTGIFVDAEKGVHETEEKKSWYRILLGEENYGKVMYFRPKTHEDCSNNVDYWMLNFAEKRKEGKIPKNKCLCIVVDSVTALVPEEIFKLIKTKEAVGKANFGKQAALNSQWIQLANSIIGSDDITESTNILLIFIMQERSKMDAGKFEEKFKGTGGEAIPFYSTISVRVTPSGAIKEGSKDKEKRVGKRHKFTIRKNRIGISDEEGYFYTSNGKGMIPLGLDLVREAVTEAIEREIIKKNGSDVRLFGEKYHGEPELIRELFEKEELFKKLKNALDNNFAGTYEIDKIEESKKKKKVK